MRKSFFPRLAAGNLRKNAKVYVPFLLTCIFTVAMFYIVRSLAFNSSIESQSVRIMLELSSQVTAVFALIFLFYTNSFLMKRRKKELGLYNILGMDKKHIAITIIWETVMIAALSLMLGLGAGIALDKLMFLAVTKVIGETVTLGFSISITGVHSSLVLFAVIFIVILINSLRQVFFSKPIELLKGGQVGEKEPKANWLIAGIGLVALGAGYWMAITVKNPVEVFNLFFIAVILVIIGTYCLFTAGSIALLKLLRKNKRYYYKAKHFISVSGMIYRMKQNAAGLGSICILSTAVLVMISSTLSLYIGMEDVLKTRYPHTVTLDVHADNAELMSGIANKTLNEKGLTPQNQISFTFLDFAALENGDMFTIDADNSLIAQLDSVRNLVFIALEDYNKMAGTEQTLETGQVLLYTNRGAYGYDTLKVFDESFLVKERLVSLPCGDILASDIVVSHYLVVNDMEIIRRLQATQKALQTEEWLQAPIWYRVAFDLAAEPDIIIGASGLIKARLDESGIVNSASCRDAERVDFMGIYGGLFFIGIFLGVLFIMATVLIIYYKQITEGYDDKERFSVMKNVGLSRAEIKKTIRSQVLTVFFLPLITAGLHIAAAFPALTQMLTILNLTNVPLFAVCVVACFAVFAVFYSIVYGLTARLYYQIVG